MDIKQRIFQACLAQIDARINTAQAAMKSAEESAQSETKSSAGDKFETGRAMMQLEKEKNKVQLIKLMEQRQKLQNIPYAGAKDKIVSGSFVICNNGHYFISIGLGKISFDGKSFVAVSPGAPLFVKMRGMQKGDTLIFNNQQIEIIDIQ